MAIGVALALARINIYIGPYQVCRGGMVGKSDQNAAHKEMTNPEYDVRVQLGRGKASLLFLTCDLTTDYVHINADYTT